MTPENFTYWLQGFFEISDSNNLSETQVQIIKDHLDLVFDKKTPNRKEKKPVLQGLNPDLLKPNGTGGSGNSICASTGGRRGDVTVYC